MFLHLKHLKVNHKCMSRLFNSIEEGISRFIDDKNY